MGLLNSRNLSKAKAMLDKNRHKIGGIVDKATDQIDKVSKGKTSNITKKVDDAAHKYSASSGSGVTHSGLDGETFPEDGSTGGSYDDAELQRRQAEAGIAATNAATAAAEAFTNLANKAASEIDAQQQPGEPPPAPPTES